LSSSRSESLIGLARKTTGNGSFEADGFYNV
jgi:hypothetical protein